MGKWVDSGFHVFLETHPDFWKPASLTPERALSGVLNSSVAPRAHRAGPASLPGSVFFLSALRLRSTSARGQLCTRAFIRLLSGGRAHPQPDSHLMVEFFLDIQVTTQFSHLKEHPLPVFHSSASPSRHPVLFSHKHPSSLSKSTPHHPQQERSNIKHRCPWQLLSFSRQLEQGPGTEIRNVNIC